MQWLWNAHPANQTTTFDELASLSTWDIWAYLGMAYSAHVPYCLTLPLNSAKCDAVYEMKMTTNLALPNFVGVVCTLCGRANDDFCIGCGFLESSGSMTRSMLRNLVNLIVRGLWFCIHIALWCASCFWALHSHLCMTWGIIVWLGVSVLHLGQLG